MALTEPLFDFFTEVLPNMEGLEMCELGDQEIFLGGFAKAFFEGRGVRHTSLDIHGLNKTRLVDLRLPIHGDLIGKFDVVTDFGTSEHVDGQYQCFKNIHDLTKVGGLMVRTLPLVGHWPLHCNFYYTMGTFQVLASICGYEIVKNCILPCYGVPGKDLLVCTALRKTSAARFCGANEFVKLGIVEVNELGTLRYT